MRAVPDSGDFAPARVVRGRGAHSGSARWWAVTPSIRVGCSIASIRGRTGQKEDTLPPRSPHSTTAVLSASRGAANSVNYFPPDSVNGVRHPEPPSDRVGFSTVPIPAGRCNGACRWLVWTSFGAVSRTRNDSTGQDSRTFLRLRRFVKARAWRLEGSPLAFRQAAVPPYLAFGPTPSVKDTPLFNPVVRPAGELPVPNGGIHRHRLTIQRDRPVFRAETEYDFLATTAAALVRGSPVSEAHIENTFLDVFRDRLGDLKSELHCIGSCLGSYSAHIFVVMCMRLRR